MKKRKQYLIDRKFQLKQTFLTVGIILFVVAIIIGIIGISAATNNGKLAEVTRQNGEMMKNLDGVMQVQDNILETMMTWVQKPGAIPKADVVREIAQTHYKNLTSIKSDITTIKKNIDDNDGIIKSNRILLLVLVILVILQGAVLFVFMIRKTHKISGPIYVMSGYMKDIIDGKIPAPRKLRKDDELQEFYELFTKMIQTLKHRGGQ